jgi:hypothetical protein
MIGANFEIYEKVCLRDLKFLLYPCEYNFHLFLLPFETICWSLKGTGKWPNMAYVGLCMFAW